MAGIRKLLCLTLCALFVFSCAIAEEDIDVEEIILNPDGTLPEPEATESPAGRTARESFIDDIIALGEEIYIKADGKPQRAYLKSDIYVCKNFTVYLFRQNRDKYRMAEYPDLQLKIPNNMPEKQCKPYSYGYCWEDVPASKVNPFVEAAQLRDEMLRLMEKDEAPKD